MSATLQITDIGYCGTFRLARIQQYRSLHWAFTMDSPEPKPTKETTTMRKHNPTDEITVGFKAEARHAEWVHRAAAKAGVTAAQYQKKVMLEWAAADLGIPPAQVAAALAPRPATQRVVSEAAKLAGVTPKELTRQAVHELAKSILDQARARGTVLPPPMPVARRDSGTQLRKVGGQ